MGLNRHKCCFIAIYHLAIKHCNWKKSSINDVLIGKLGISHCHVWLPESNRWKIVDSPPRIVISPSEWVIEVVNQFDQHLFIENWWMNELLPKYPKLGVKQPELAESGTNNCGNWSNYCNWRPNARSCLESRLFSFQTLTRSPVSFWASVTFFKMLFMRLL